MTEVIDKDLEEQFRREKHLNIQLKERLKQCEVEKFQIVEQLRELEAQKDVTVVARNEGANGDLKKSAMGVEDMMRYRHTILYNLDEVVRDLDVLRVDDEAAARAVDHLRANIEATAVDRVRIAGDLQVMQMKLGDGTHVVNRDCLDLRHELARNKALLGCKVVARALGKVIGRRQKRALHDLKVQLRDDDKQIGSVLAFRKVCLNYRHRRQEKYFNRWLMRGMRPMALVRHNQGMSDYQ